MKNWQEFLDSLHSPGGTLFLLSLFVVAMLALVIHVLHHSENGQVTTVILSTFSGFQGALLGKFVGKERTNGSAKEPDEAPPSPEGTSK